jgi:hypothetical protein
MILGQFLKVGINEGMSCKKGRKEGGREKNGKEGRRRRKKRRMKGMKERKTEK